MVSMMIALEGYSDAFLFPMEYLEPIVKEQWNQSLESFYRSYTHDDVAWLVEHATRNQVNMIKAINILGPEAEHIREFLFWEINDKVGCNLDYASREFINPDVEITGGEVLEKWIIKHADDIASEVTKVGHARGVTRKTVCYAPHSAAIIYNKAYINFEVRSARTQDLSIKDRIATAKSKSRPEKTEATSLGQIGQSRE